MMYLTPIMKYEVLSILQILQEVFPDLNIPDMNGKYGRVMEYHVEVFPDSIRLYTKTNITCFNTMALASPWNIREVIDKWRSIIMNIPQDINHALRLGLELNLVDELGRISVTHPIRIKDTRTYQELISDIDRKLKETRKLMNYIGGLNENLSTR